ncbi:MAG: hypothetical protein GEU99_12070 [Luteitalea sp.]|nr:hypothetical protein [Luteitalea sp.]
MCALGAEAKQSARVYFTGGATAVLNGWRATTIDVDLKIVPEQDRLLRAIPRLKEELQINVELAAPDDFIPELPGWEERSTFVQQERRLTFCHYDYYAQVLSKLERGHAQDVADVEEMLRRGLIDRQRLLDLFTAIEPHLYHFPAIDPPTFRRAVVAFVESADADSDSS